MEYFDGQMAARVWQRVQGIQPAADLRDHITALLQEELTDMEIYRRLQLLLPGQKQQLQQLEARTRQCTDTLRGILALMDAHPEPETFPRPKELPVAMLRRCYGGTLSRISRYRQLSEQPEYAPGFFGLAELSRKRCMLLLQALGRTLARGTQ